MIVREKKKKERDLKKKTKQNKKKVERSSKNESKTKKQKNNLRKFRPNQPPLCRFLVSVTCIVCYDLQLSKVLFQSHRHSLSNACVV